LETQSGRVKGLVMAMKSGVTKGGDSEPRLGSA
jgi:hypothetical protein